ncbi:bifunctional 3-deoxy-7-phosphoheptulonate synthase/chorismate mutase type II [Penaeicola halotolerans]|uniref:bifunctional 3-deoxy-7-phosphoheptulonate synthase/chorismate mutase type II n=1 Tax=Penaeicola halotolerans TaxID=2793196 RepID=UPI001CF85538|nr:bifunctional 3-deoxy-7-phosphoheptulonate synthase/chorismate mutase type II [Penaeicola halotolerans]
MLELPDIQSIKNWGIEVKNPFVIAGPCSAETREQVLETTAQLAQKGIHTIRAGVWKPRTRPNNFEGVGEKAMPWLVEAKERYGVKFAVEVANPKHVEVCLKNGIDVLWIGARSTVNPFTVQEIADALTGVDIPVLIKNPINPDLALWMGAIERVYNAGIRKLGAIHRGFSSFQNTTYRNAPMWQIAIELKTKLPQLPLICDPSHMGGKRELIQPLAQMSLDLNYDGLIIESHITPDLAWSDASQQVTPDRLAEILSALKTRQITVDNVEYQSQLEIIREQIDEADREILEAISRRMRLVEKIGYYKKANNVAALQMDRWHEIFSSRPEWARALQINPNFIEELYRLIHDESIKKQTDILDSDI